MKYIREASGVSLSPEQRKNLNILARILSKIGKQPLESFVICKGNYSGHYGVSIESSIWYSILSHEFGYCPQEEKLNKALSERGLYSEPINSWLLGCWPV